MALYRERDLEGWEYKFLRSATGRFGNPVRLRSALEEEARAGFFDGFRVRLKRPISA